MSAPQSRSPVPAEMILVVEDEVLIRMVISEYLRECGFKVIEAANADEAIIILEQANLKIDIVFSDIEMPGSMDGFGLSRWLRHNKPELKVILAGTVTRAANAAADLCDEGPTLAKPYEPRAVVDRIRRLLGRTI
jgi:CheY-like chemotaxis protein